MNVKLETNFWVQYFLAPELQLFVSSLENCQNFSKTSTPQAQAPVGLESRIERAAFAQCEWVLLAGLSIVFYKLYARVAILPT